MGISSEREQLLLALRSEGDGERFGMLEGLGVKGTATPAPGRCLLGCHLCCNPIRWALLSS